MDDDPAKQNLRLHGVRVIGSLEDLPEVSEATGAKTLIVAIGDPSPELLERARSAAAEEGMNVRVMPSVQQMLTGGVSPSGLRDLDIEDLLGRSQVDTDVSAIADYLNGRRVLVTGAGGSIGQQLCVEINKHGPAELIMLDRDETGLQHSELRIRGVGLLDTKEVVLADIRDGKTMKKLFKERKPDVVFHAAALKHLPMLDLATQARQPVVHYEHTDIGYNYRLSNILAALGRAQLSRLDSMIDRRRALRAGYQELFDTVPGVEVFGAFCGGEPCDEEDNYWLTSIIVDPEVAGFTQADLGTWLDRHNIENRPLWKPMHMQPVFADAPAMVSGASQRLFETGLTLPSGSGLTDDQFAFVLATIEEFLDAEASRD